MKQAKESITGDLIVLSILIGFFVYVMWIDPIEAAEEGRTYELYTDAYPVGMTTNEHGEFTYWIVEWSWLDCAGNIHRVRQDVDVVGRGNQHDVIEQGIKQLLARPEIDEILASVCEDPPTKLEVEQ